MGNERSFQNKSGQFTQAKMIEELLKEKDRKEAGKMIEALGQRTSASLEFHIDDIFKYLQSKNFIGAYSNNSIEDKLRSIKEWVFKYNMSEVRGSTSHPMFQMNSRIKLD